MKLIVITGGARSGKSRYAQELAAEVGGAEVTVVATAAASDAEMEERIARHRANRPAQWRTVEAQRDAAAAVRAAETDVVLLDCLTLLASNAFLAAMPHGHAPACDAAYAEAAAVLEDLTERPGLLIVVTNELGLGVVPDSALGRWFRDAMGEINQRFAAAADEVILVVSGVPLRLKERARERVNE